MAKSTKAAKKIEHVPPALTPDSKLDVDERGETISPAVDPDIILSTDEELEIIPPDEPAPPAEGP